MGGRQTGVRVIRPARGDELFVDPLVMALGIGRALPDWPLTHAIAADARRMRLASDPFAGPFFLRTGARRLGKELSGSIPGRMLPPMEFTLAERPSAGR